MLVVTAQKLMPRVSELTGPSAKPTSNGSSYAPLKANPVCSQPSPSVKVTQYLAMLELEGSLGRRLCYKEECIPALQQSGILVMTLRTRDRTIPVRVMSHGEGQRMVQLRCLLLVDRWSHRRAQGEVLLSQA